ncbi:peptidoglycan-associated lipoprotein [Candidatus Blochmanniella vafra str. BVAF]|uniref:Peptidoglycan-associated protein n=1 Tax=Blochmanniella vafra (strain BVAF) TaxID=859654 RepID=E8Q6Y8_BLOVB|nr:peptidoglycan-associated lipoprotein Pal [Candidatus Blochmannia vafer]ADV33735.1 peptidoglycan-associated lipoprotein [Candidatus Blochmannia vafer str. BVAF]
MKISQSTFITYIYRLGISIIMFLYTSCTHISKDYEKHVDNIDYLNKLDTNSIDNIINQPNKLNRQHLQSKNIIYFPLDQYNIPSVFFDILDVHAIFLRKNPLHHIIIEGHTDERGTPEYNIGLGERRAYSIKKYLQSKGVLSNQISTISYGKEKPVSFGHTEESYSQNRRGVLLY